MDNHTTEIENLRHEVAECKSRLFAALVALRDLRNYVPPRDWIHYWERVLVTNTNYAAEVLDLVNKKKLDQPPVTASGQ
jgi:hypothetical protein